MNKPTMHPINGKCLTVLLLIFTLTLFMILWYVIKIESEVAEMLLHQQVMGNLGNLDSNLGFENSYKAGFANVRNRPDNTYLGENKPNNDQIIKAEEEQIRILDVPEKVLNFSLPQMSGENIVSMSLWGSDNKYTVGAIRNAELVKKFFPGWKLRIYTETPSGNSRFGSVSQGVINKLRENGADIFYVDPDESRVPPMMWRFLVADDMSVDHFIIRDSDSRLSARDASAVYSWIQSGKAFNCIRDHPSHASAAVSGGLWGGMPASLKNILRRSWETMMFGYSPDYSQDMGFLADLIWPRVKNHAYCSDSVSCDIWQSAHPFPVPRYNTEHVGQVFDEFEHARSIDENIIRKTPINEKCSPAK